MFIIVINSDVSRNSATKCPIFRKDVVESTCKTHASSPGKYLEIYYTPVCMKARITTYLYIGPSSECSGQRSVEMRGGGWVVAGRLVSAWVLEVMDGYHHTLF